MILINIICWGKTVLMRLQFEVKLVLFSCVNIKLISLGKKTFQMNLYVVFQNLKRHEQNYGHKRRFIIAELYFLPHFDPAYHIGSYDQYHRGQAGALSIPDVLELRAES